MTERDAEFLPHELLRECLRQSQGRYELLKIQNQIALYQSRSFKVVNTITPRALDSNNINVPYQKLNEQRKIQQIVNNEARIKAIAHSVRQSLMAEGILGNQSQLIPTLRRKNLDKLAIIQAHHYQRGDVIKFQTDLARFSKNSYDSHSLQLRKEI